MDIFLKIDCASEFMVHYKTSAATGTKVLSMFHMNITRKQMNKVRLVLHPYTPLGKQVKVKTQLIELIMKMLNTLKKRPSNLNVCLFNHDNM